MKRSALLTCLLVLVLISVVSLLRPSSLYAVDWCPEGPYYTSQYYAAAATCVDAQAQYRSLARPEANAFCGGSFYVYLFTLPPCQQDGSQWVVDGPAEFYCRVPC